jgi:hypothetical protein
VKQSPIFKFLASLKLAVVLFVLFVVILALATYYESAYDTQTAQHLVYKSPLFAFFLLVFFVNIFCSTAIRFPWKRKQIGFVLTHVGILMLLAGAAVTMVAGIDGSMMIQEGQSSSKVLLNDPVFFVGPPSQDLREVGAEFRWRPPTPERPARVNLGEGLTAEVQQYLHHSRLHRYFKASPQGVPALRMRIFNERVDESQWLTAGKGDVAMGPAKFRLLRANDSKQLKAMLAPGFSNRGELQLLVSGEPLQIPVSELVEGKPVSLGAFEVTLKRYLAHAVVKNEQLVSESERPVNPCLEVRLSDAQGNWQEWLLFSHLPQYNTRVGSKGKELPLRVLYAWDSPLEDERVLTFVYDTLGKKLWSKVDRKPAQLVEVKSAFATGWMNLQVEVKEFFPSATEVREFEAVEVEKGDQNAPPPAILVRFAGSKDEQPCWMERGDVREVTLASGKILVVGYAYRSVDLGFAVLLRDFKMEYDPGTRNPAAFMSDVEVAQKKYRVQMNEPLLKDGFKFFQSSYSETPGQPAISIFTVAKDPGIVLKYLGSITVVMGIAIMFLMRPYQLRGSRTAARAETRT